MDQTQPTGRRPEAPQKHTSILPIILTLLIIILTSLTGYLIYQNQTLKQKLNILQQPPSQACTLEAKLCPDGSSVGRNLPNCEFAPCPEISTTPTPVLDPTTDWQTYTNQQYGYKFKCPSASMHKIELSSGDGLTKPFYQEICYQDSNQVVVRVVSLDNNNPIDNQTKEIIKDNLKFRIRGFDKNYFDQILSTFQFTN